MSRAKKTKRAKQYSANNLYRHFTELSNHAKKEVATWRPKTVKANTDTANPQEGTHNASS